MEPLHFGCNLKLDTTELDLMRKSSSQTCPAFLVLTESPDDALKESLVIWHDLPEPCSARHITMCVALVIQKVEPVKLSLPLETHMYGFNSYHHAVSLPGRHLRSGAVDPYSFLTGPSLHKLHLLSSLIEDHSSGYVLLCVCGNLLRYA